MGNLIFLVNMQKSVNKHKKGRVQVLATSLTRSLPEFLLPILYHIRRVFCFLSHISTTAVNYPLTQMPAVFCR